MSQPVSELKDGLPIVEMEDGDIELPKFGAIDQSFLDRLTGRNALLEDYASKLQATCVKLQAQVKALKERQD